MKRTFSVLLWSVLITALFAGMAFGAASTVTNMTIPATTGDIRTVSLDNAALESADVISFDVAITVQAGDPSTDIVFEAFTGGAAARKLSVDISFDISKQPQDHIDKYYIKPGTDENADKWLIKTASNDTAARTLNLHVTLHRKAAYNTERLEETATVTFKTTEDQSNNTYSQTYTVNFVNWDDTTITISTDATTSTDTTVTADATTIPITLSKDVKILLNTNYTSPDKSANNPMWDATTWGLTDSEKTWDMPNTGISLDNNLYVSWDNTGWLSISGKARLAGPKVLKITAKTNKGGSITKNYTIQVNADEPHEQVYFKDMNYWIPGGTTQSTAYDITTIADRSGDIFPGDKIQFVFRNYGPSSVDKPVLEFVTTDSDYNNHHGFTITTSGDNVSADSDPSKSFAMVLLSHDANDEVDSGRRLTKDTTYYLKMTGSNPIGTTTEYFKFTVKTAPVFNKDNKTGSFTWGTAGSFTPVMKNDSIDGISFAISPDVSADELADIGLTFDTATGTISGTWDTISPDVVSVDNESSTTKTYTLVAYKGARGMDSMDVKLTFRGTKPVFTTSQTDVEGWSTALLYSQDIANSAKAIEITSPGSLDITISSPDTTPTGLSYDITSTDSKVWSIKFKGVVPEAWTGTVTITAKNSSGAVTIKPTFTINAGTLNVTGGTGANGAGALEYGTGSFIVGDSIDMHPLNLLAEKPYSDDDRTQNPKKMTVIPGPVKWTATGLPKGIKLSWDKTADGDSTVAWLSGHFSKAQEATPYTITATVPATGDSVTFTGEITVLVPPKISTSSLKKLTVDTEYSETLKATNVDKWTVKISGDDEFTAPGGSAVLKFDEAKTAITGTIDRYIPGNEVVVRIEVENAAGIDSKDLSLDVIPVKPKFTSTKLGDMAKTDTKTVTATGTMPIMLNAWIDEATAQKYFESFGYDGTKSIDITDSSDNIVGLVFTPGKDDAGNGNGTGTLTTTDSNVQMAYKNLPIMFNASSDFTSIDKKLTVTLKGDAPVWYFAQGNDNYEKADDTMTIRAVGSQDIGIDEAHTVGGYNFYVDGDGPIQVTVTPDGQDNEKNGLYVISADDPNHYGVDKKLYTVSGEPLGTKETKTNVKLKVKNLSTGETDTVKLAITSLIKPKFRTSEPVKKETEVKGKLSAKMPVSGSKDGLGWRILNPESTTESEDITDEMVADLKSDYGITFDPTKGTFTATSATAPTLDDGNSKYESMDIYVQAYNTAGSGDIAIFKLGIKGEKPVFKTKTLTFDRTEPDFEGATVVGRTSTPNYLVLSNIDNSVMEDIANVQYSFDAASSKDVDKLGFGDIDSKNNEGYLQTKTGATELTRATKKTNITFNATNYESTGKGIVTVTIRDPEPEISDITVPTMYFSGDKHIWSSDLSLVIPPTGDTNISWALKAVDKPSSGVGVKLTAVNSGDIKGYRAYVEWTIPAVKKAVEDTSGSFTITATNKDTKESYTTPEIAYSVAGYTPPSKEAPEEEPTDVAASPEAEAPAKTIDDVELGTGTVTFGEARTADSLTDAQRAALEEAGYVIVKVLPELTTDVSGQYDVAAMLDVDSLELAEEAAEGAELAYFAFPVDAETTEDDEIADFFDEDGADTAVVPESKKVLVFPWLTAEKTYAPVIAVKVDAVAEAKDEAENLKEGDVITEEAVEAKTEAEAVEPVEAE